ncbi:serine hydrolase domain-containing protein [Terracidiphilus gabretensis]|uniref:serine hydrolase domain-containing protein n=1 Tax=Terracidiphilus gabretensis TaxID=1577687 RepID=UPI00071B292A|nr:serine hydrolase domain-containing protein [Terracidiphilus gabretensis]
MEVLDKPICWLQFNVPHSPRDAHRVNEFSGDLAQSQNPSGGLRIAHYPFYSGENPGTKTRLPAYPDQGDQSIMVSECVCNGWRNRWWFRLALPVLFLACGLPGVCGVPHSSSDDSRQEIDHFLRTLHERGQFNGAILVGDKNGILYEAAFGQADRPAGTKFTTETQSCLASVSKPFTALAIMMLVQDGSLRLDDPVSKYVDGLKEPIASVTIRQLLNHTSGIPDYGNTNIEHPDVTTEEVLHALRTLDHLEFPQGQQYSYSNSGYVLLGAAVAKASGMPFPQFLSTRILQPVGMKQTFVLTHEGQKTRGTAKAYNDFGDLDDYAEFVTGDGGMYSTVEDLYLFDRALYRGSLVTQTTLDEMFTPATVRKGSTTYGLGWNIEDTGPGKRVWHTGSTAGFRAYFERRLANRRVVIMLTNIGNSKRIEISAAINNILDGSPFTYPKRSGAVELEGVYRSSGIAGVLATYQTLKQKSIQDYDLSEGELNTLGYRVLYADHKGADAIKVFELNAKEHPSSSNAFDSLAEAYEVNGDTKAAKTNYERALSLDPTNEHARTALAKLK